MLELNHVCKTFNSGTVNAKTALNDLNLTLRDGDFVTVIGGNGAGKSTMLNAIAGSFQIDSGSIVIDGKDVTSLPVAMEPSTVRSATSRIRKVMYTPMAITPQIMPCAMAPGMELSSAEMKLIVLLLFCLGLPSKDKEWGYPPMAGSSNGCVCRTAGYFLQPGAHDERNQPSMAS